MYYYIVKRNGQFPWVEASLNFSSHSDYSGPTENANRALKGISPYSFPTTLVVPPYVTIIIINHSSPSPPCGLFDNNIIWVCDYGRGDKAHRCGNNVTTSIYSSFERAAEKSKTNENLPL